MHPSRQRPGAQISPSSAANIPTTQAQALNRRHTLDQQQKAFQGTHVPVGVPGQRRRPPA